MQKGPLANVGVIKDVRYTHPDQKGGWTNWGLFFTKVSSAFWARPPSSSENT